MYYNDHNPPHFHAQYGEFKAEINIGDFALSYGSLPPKALGLVIEWASTHKKELEENWAMARLQKPLTPIPPLK